MTAVMSMVGLFKPQGGDGIHFCGLACRIYSKDDSHKGGDAK